MSWETFKLEEVCTKVTDGTHDTPSVVECGFPLIKGKDISKGYIDFENCAHVEEHEHLAIIKRSHPEKGDALFANIGNSIGDCVYVNTDRPFSIKNVALFKPDSTKIDSRFLFYVVSGKKFIGEILAAKSGAAQPFVSLAALRRHKINIPPLLIQNKISGILSAYDNLIENNLKRIKLLEEMAQITYEEWFVRLRFPGHEITPINSDTGLPEGWGKLKLSDTCQLIMGQSPKSEFYNSDGEGIPFYQGVKDYGARFPTTTCWSTSGNRYAERGDVLFSVRAPVGRLNIALEKMILGRGLAAIRHKKESQGYLYCLLKKQFFDEDMMGGGAIFNSVTKNDMLRIETIEPDEKTLRKFSSLVDAIDRKIEIVHLQNLHLREARDILLPRLMTGMIDVEQYDPSDLLKEVA